MGGIVKGSKQKCVELRKKDFTLNQIVKMTGLSKSTVHFHIQNIPLSKGKQREIKEANATRARLIAAKRRGVSARLFTPFSEWNEKRVRLVAHLLFDGEIKQRGCMYSNRNLVLLQEVEGYMRTMYPIEPKRYLNNKTGVSRICYYNVSLGAYIKDKSIELLKNIHAMPLNFKQEFLRAFFDDEGCIDYSSRRKHRRIRGYQKNVKILEITQKLLSDFGINSRIQLPNEITIVGEKNLRQFEKKIGFSPGVRINGKRSNSIWKQSLEKREILRRAIESYKPEGSPGVHRTQK